MKLEWAQLHDLPLDDNNVFNQWLAKTESNQWVTGFLILYNPLREEYTATVYHVCGDKERMDPFDGVWKTKEQAMEFCQQYMDERGSHGRDDVEETI